MKEIKEEYLVISIRLAREGGVGSTEVTCRADYEVVSEDLKVNRSIDVDLTIAQKTAIKDFGADILKKIKESEGIA